MFLGLIYIKLVYSIWYSWNFGKYERYNKNIKFNTYIFKIYIQ